MLEGMGLTVTIANNGKEAVNLVEGNDYSLVLMDCHMPVLDGYTATQQIRQGSKQSINVIAMTANAMAGDRERCLAAGMNDYISKPIRQQQLRETLAKWLT